MRNAVCVTVDVEDFYDGMAALGHDVARPPGPPRGLGSLLERLEAQPGKPKVTLFVVANYAPAVRAELAAFAAAGHEIASHGADHGRLPTGAASEWLRKGREVLEDLLGVSVRGFRSPRFDIPGDGGLPRYRDELAAAGYHYVSDPPGWGRPRRSGRCRCSPGAASASGEGAINVCCPSRRWRRPHGARPGRRCSTTTPTTSTAPCPGWVPSDRLCWPGNCWAAAGSRPSCGASPRGSGAKPAHMSPAEFDTYFHDRASRFAAFYRSEPVARALGRGPLFDRLRRAVDIVTALGARSVLDVGCGSGPLFAPLAVVGVHVTGIDPAPAMVALARAEAERHPGSVTVQERGWETVDEHDAYDAAVALGVFDYVDDPADLLGRMGRAAPHVIGSFPAPGLRLQLRKLRYGARGVHVHGYRPDDLRRLGSASGLVVADLRPLGRAGHLVHFTRAEV